MDRLLSLLLIFSFLCGCATHSQKGGVQTNSGTPISEEAAIGQQIHAHILNSFYVYSEPKMVNYLNKVGSAVAAHAQRKDLNYQFTLLYNEKIYATSAPGGYIYLTTGMIYFLDNEAELAAVLAHEVGELQFKDPRLSETRRALEQITRGGAMVAPAFGSIGALAALGLIAVNNLAAQKGETAENRLHASDRNALHYLLEAGYDPQGLIDVQHKFLNASKEVTPYFYDYYQSRPITNERFAAMFDEFSRLPLQGRSLSTYHKEYEEMTRGIKEIYR